MRRWVSAFVVLAGLVFAAPAVADSPVEVYNDFASDGTLSCSHSRAALKGALKDASLQQYGDPLTFVQLKLAIRKQLAGGCRVLASVRPTGARSRPGESSPGTVPSEQTNQKQKARKGPGGSGSEQSTRQAAAPSNTSGSADGKHSGGMILLGISLLLLALGSGGWAARRAFGDRG
jgi:hypothetical protein